MTNVISGNIVENVPDLTPREKQITQLIRQDLTAQEIARKLHISIATVRAHQQSIYIKFGLSGQGAATELRLRWTELTEINPSKGTI